MLNIQNLVLIFLFSINFAAENKNQDWTGRWFPQNPNETTASEDSTYKASTPSTPKDPWKGKWFPHEPFSSDTDEENDNDSFVAGASNGNFENDRIMGIPNKDCDDGKTNLHTDFSPDDPDHALKYLCLETKYSHGDIEPILTEYDIPKYYTPVHKCMNESINYLERLPTLGYHRPLWAAYGEYKYLPPQRWLHNIEHGAIVLIYHPCANGRLVDDLKKIVKSCLYRHVITPHHHLTPERPFGLAAWGVSLEFSIFDRQLVADFIRKYAKIAPEKTSRDGQYNMLLIEPAKIISDQNDTLLCRDDFNVI